jgi:hypothetical protein
MEMAQLQDPVTLLGDTLHAIEIVDDKCHAAMLNLGGEGIEDASPAKGSFFAREQPRIEEEGGFSGTSFGRHEVQNSGTFAKVKAQTVG